MKLSDDQRNLNPHFNPKKSELPLNQRVECVEYVGRGGEIVGTNNIKGLLQKKDKSGEFPIAYDGFEPSGRMHIAQGILRTITVNKLVDAGFVFKFWVADWFAMLNNKYGGDQKQIRLVGEYFIQVWKAAGMQLENVLFLWASDEINRNANAYWLMVMDISRQFTLDRINRCLTIMGREAIKDLGGDDEDEPVDDEEKQQVSKQQKQVAPPAAHFFYPCMQACDIFYLNADVCSLGMDQRKVNMLALEYCDQMQPPRTDKPIVISHHMIEGLTGVKMAKSDANSAIFMEDDQSAIQSKINSAVCPPKQENGNPILAYCQYLIFPSFNEMQIQRPEQYGGDVHYKTYEQLAEAYQNGDLHPKDLKEACFIDIDRLVKPIRDHFKTNQRARQLLEEIKTFQQTK